MLTLYILIFMTPMMQFLAGIHFLVSEKVACVGDDVQRMSLLRFQIFFVDKNIQSSGCISIYIHLNGHFH